MKKFTRSVFQFRKNNSAVLMNLVPILLFFGLLLDASADVLTARFDTPTDISLTTAAYSAAGNQIDLSLNFSPTTSANLLVINNTGLNRIAGEFTNLTQGQTIDLSHDGSPYRYVANYFGGTGNDLVLEWTRREIHTWGGNDYGRLGVSSAIRQSYVPVTANLGILSDKTITAISAGGNSLALCSDGTLAYWGESLGTNAFHSNDTPVAISRAGILAGKVVIAISNGGGHALALCSDGTVVGWGNNSAGQLGDGTRTARSQPVELIQTGALAGKSIVAISAGSNHSLGLSSNGQIFSWGSNYDSGTLGTGAFGGFAVEPAEVVRTGILAGKTVVAVSAGRNHQSRPLRRWDSRHLGRELIRRARKWLYN